MYKFIISIVLITQLMMCEADLIAYDDCVGSGVRIYYVNGLKSNIPGWINKEERSSIKDDFNGFVLVNGMCCMKPSFMIRKLEDELKLTKHNEEIESRKQEERAGKEEIEDMEGVNSAVAQKNYEVITMKSTGDLSHLICASSVSGTKLNAIRQLRRITDSNAIAVIGNDFINADLVIRKDFMGLDFISLFEEDVYHQMGLKDIIIFMSHGVSDQCGNTILINSVKDPLMFLRLADVAKKLTKQGKLVISLNCNQNFDFSKEKKKTGGSYIIKKTKQRPFGFYEFSDTRIDWKCNFQHPNFIENQVGCSYIDRYTSIIIPSALRRDVISTKALLLAHSRIAFKNMIIKDVSGYNRAKQSKSYFKSQDCSWQPK